MTTGRISNARWLHQLIQRPYKFDFEGKQMDAAVGWNSPEYFFKKAEKVHCC